MSITNSILKTLNMKDNNIKFEENFIKEETVKGRRSLIYKGYLDTSPQSCPNCGVIKEEGIVKNGMRTSRIKIPKISELNAYLDLTKQRYRCKCCNKGFTSRTSVVEYRCRISNNTKHSVIKYAKETLTCKIISSIHNISSVTVQRVISKIYDVNKLYKHYLPEVMCFDEFHYKNRIMTFNLCDCLTGKTIDLVENRKLENLIKYFRYYTDKCRSEVKHIVIDMYKPYISLIKECFNNAKISIDLFHVVQLISRSLNKTRIKTMKKDKENYNKMKRYWRLLLTSRLDLDCSHWKKYTCFKSLMTEVDIVDYIISKDEELKNSYYLYQNILYALQHKDYNLFESIINNEHNNISSYLAVAIDTLKEFSSYIKNTLEYPKYSNGIMERNNNTIKLLKRIGFGFRNLLNFKTRIMIITNFFRNKKDNSFSVIIP